MQRWQSTEAYVSLAVDLRRVGLESRRVGSRQDELSLWPLHASRAVRKLKANMSAVGLDDKCACKLVHEEQQAFHVGLESRPVVRALAETVSCMLPGCRVPCELAA